MQSMDEQPLRPPQNQQSGHYQFHQEQQEGQTSERTPEGFWEQSRGTIERQPTQQARSQENDTQAPSEQVPFSYPPTPATYSPASGVYPAGATMQQAVHTPENTWTFPQQPGLSAAPQMGPLAAFQPSPPQGSGGQPRRSGLRTGALLALLALLAVVFGTGLFAGWQFGRTGSLIGSPSSFQPGNNVPVNIPPLTGANGDTVREAVIHKVQPGVVQIDVVSANQHALGSGVIIDGRGYIVTNNHVVTNATSIQVTLADGSMLTAQTIGTDPADDLAVIKVTPPPAGLSIVGLADSSQLRVGQEVLAIGSPLGNAETVTSGIVSALSRSISEGQNGPTIPDAIQTDAPINPGNSGGALVDLQGNLVGIPTLNAIDTEFNTPANGLGFAIPANRVKFIAQQLIATGHVAHTGRAIIGVAVTTVDQSVAARNHLSTASGALVESVTSGGPGAAATIQPGDVIVQVDTAVIHNTADLSSALVQHAPGQTVTVKVFRNNEPLTLHVTLGELPPS